MKSSEIILKRFVLIQLNTEVCRLQIVKFVRKSGSGEFGIRRVKKKQLDHLKETFLGVGDLKNVELLFSLLFGHSVPPNPNSAGLLNVD